jgi:energy-coupling factor transporter ATP-binding protein EcfA2
VEGEEAGVREMELRQHGVYLKDITFKDGSKFHFERDSIVLLTGPNNCGKSQTLKDISQHLIIGKKLKIIEKVDSGFQGSMQQILEDLIHQPILKQNRQILDNAFANSNGVPAMFLSQLYSQPHLYKLVLSGFMLYLDTLTRLVNLGVPLNVTFIMNVQPFALTSLSYLFEDEAIAEKVYNLTKATFGKGALMNHSSFQDAHLYFVDKESSPSRNDKGTPAFARWFEGQDKVNEQGDGVQSFSSILISLLQQLTPLVLLDEPEAFLHPPQIRELARIFATETPPETQVVVSTHSDDFVRGIIDFAGARASVVRMTRTSKSGSDYNHIKKLDSDQISKLWNDPLLKTSDVLTSLFHRVAIIVEGDSDARFIRAMIDALSGDGCRAPDIKFFHCGGKDRIPKIAGALRAIGVPVLAVVDIDILDNKPKFLELIESLGGEADAFNQPLSALLKFVAEKKSTASAAEAQSKLGKLFDKIEPGKAIPGDILREMSEALKSASAWSFIKQTGETFFSGGEQYNNLQDILHKSEQLGILINRSGELENFCRTIGSKRKSEWLAEVLRKDLKRDIDLKEAREFAQKLLDKSFALADEA